MRLLSSLWPYRCIFTTSLYANMKSFLLSVCLFSLMLATISCKTETPSGSTDTASSATPGLKVAYINGDSILLNFTAFREESERLDAKQMQLEKDLQNKGAALEREIMDYQKKAQEGSLTGKEMQAREKYLAGRQEALFAERDKLAKEILAETEVINNRLQGILKDVLDSVRREDGYDFIFSYVQGGQILIADERFDITDKVLARLNAAVGDLE